MSQRFLSSLSAVLMLSTLGVTPSSYGSESVVNDEGVEENVSAESVFTSRLDDSAISDSAHRSDSEITGSMLARSSGSENIRPTEGLVIANSGLEFSGSQEPVKVGEYQNQPGLMEAPTAVIHSHVMDGREAATVYVDGIPVLTLLGDEAIAQSTSQGSQPDEAALADQSLDPTAGSAVMSSSETPDVSLPDAFLSDDASLPEDALNAVDALTDSLIEDKAVKLPSSQQSTSSDKGAELSGNGASGNGTEKSNDTLASRPDANVRDTVGDTVPVENGMVDAESPVQQATAIAARINQVSRDGIDPSDIIAAWDDEAELYVIKLGDTVLIEFHSDVMLPDTTGDMAEDVLQATNRIRRQLGADPLTAIEGAPNSSQNYVAVGPVQFSFTGVASWYGPGFHGRRSASGEIFNQNAMTAAHRTLPFGTLVRVTNLNNGESVTVRITDRGPFGGGRVIDLSAGAARAIGMIHSGVATVQAEVIGTP